MNMFETPLIRAQMITNDNDIANQHFCGVKNVVKQ